MDELDEDEDDEDEDEEDEPDELEDEADELDDEALDELDEPEAPAVPPAADSDAPPPHAPSNTSDAAMTSIVTRFRQRIACMSLFLVRRADPL